MLKMMGTATLLAAASIALAQTPGRAPADTASSKCLSMAPAEREKCLREEGVTSGTGRSSSGKASPGPEVPGSSASSKCLALAAAAEREKCLRKDGVTCGGGTRGRK
jgi:hypothetical protein